MTEIYRPVPDVFYNPIHGWCYQIEGSYNIIGFASEEEARSAAEAEIEQNLELYQPIHPDETCFFLAPLPLLVPSANYSKNSPYPKFWFGDAVWVKEREHLGTAIIYGINYKNEKPWEYEGWWYILKFAKQQEAFSFYSEDKIYSITKVFE